MSAIVLEDILTRICAVEEQLIAGSKAYPNTFVITQDSLYWTNQVEFLTPESVLGTRNALYTVRVSARLHRGKFTEMQTNPVTLEAKCREDLATVAAYFAEAPNRDLISLNYPTKYGALATQSALYQSGVIAQLAAPDGTAHIGTVHIFTLAYRA